MKKAALVAFAVAAFMIAGCSSNYKVKQEYPKSPSLSRYKVIKVGWIEYPAASWRAYGFKNQREWLGVVRDLNRKSLHDYLSGALMGKKVIGPTAASNAVPAGGADLFVKLGFRGISRRYNMGAGNADYMTVAVEFYDIRRRRKIYGGTVTVNSYRAFPHNWKATHFEGRLDNEVYNLARFIASKF